MLLLAQRVGLQRVPLQLLARQAAWALGQPSARASAKLANSTVNHSHSATPMVNRLGWAMARAVVKALPT